MYQEVILDHYKNPTHAGLKAPFDAEVHHVNPSCGDELTLRVKLSDDKPFSGVSQYPARVKCALLGWKAFQAAAAESMEEQE